MNEQLIEFAQLYTLMREAQNNYFASKKENRYGDKKLLAASKKIEAKTDQMAREILKAN